MDTLFSIASFLFTIGALWLGSRLIDRLGDFLINQQRHRLMARAFDYVTCTDEELDKHHSEQIEILSKQKHKSGERAAAHREISAMRHAAEARRQIFKQWQSQTS